MIAPPASVRVWLAAGRTDMRKGFDGLATLVQEKLRHDPFGGQVFAFRGRRGDLIKVLWWDGQGLCLSAKRGVRDSGAAAWGSATGRKDPPAPPPGRPHRLPTQGQQAKRQAPSRRLLC